MRSLQAGRAIRIQRTTRNPPFPSHHPCRVNLCRLSFASTASSERRETEPPPLCSLPPRPPVERDPRSRTRPDALGCLLYVSFYARYVRPVWTCPPARLSDDLFKHRLREAKRRGRRPGWLARRRTGWPEPVQSTDPTVAPAQQLSLASSPLISSNPLISSTPSSNHVGHLRA